MKYSTFNKIAKNPALAIKPLATRGMLNFLSDESYLKLVFKAEMGKKLDLDNPKSFNEKIQWLKLNDRKEEYIQWVDKIEAKKKAGSCIGASHVVPIIKCWNQPSEICFDDLPELCVIKCNHDQGSTVIYRRGYTNEKSLREHLKKCLKHNAFSETREWPYSKIQPKIFCEEYLADEIIDYKLFCFNEEPKIINIGHKSSVDNKTRITFLDLNWKPLPFQRDDFDRVVSLPDIPDCFDELLFLAKKISKGTTFVRTDFFIINNDIYFSEFTLYPTSGFIRFNPREADYEVGSWLKL